MRIFVIALVMTAAGALGAEKFGKPLTLDKPIAVATIMAAPDQYVGKTVQVKGKVTEVCEMMGCWLQIVDNEKAIRIKVNDGEIMFPKNSVGRTAIAEGTLKKLTLTKDQAIARAKHEAEEQHRKFNPDSIKTGMIIYQVQGTGAQMLD